MSFQDWYDECIEAGGKTSIAKFIASISAKYIRYQRRVVRLPSVRMCDPFTVYIALHPEHVQEKLDLHVGIELQGSLTRGLSVFSSRQNGKKICVIQKIQMEGFKETFQQLLTQPRF